jgi:Helicase conserved C-terminal domain
VPQRRRRSEIQCFKSDPQCRVFLSTDSGSTGLNLQNASVVINCDLPWNPARLEQRIARAWRKHQTQAVTVIHLVSEHTIEHSMLGTLAMKRSLADGVLDLRGDLASIKMTSGRQAFLARLEQLTSSVPAGLLRNPEPEALPADRPLAFGQRARQMLGSALVRCEECYPAEGYHSVLVAVVEDDVSLWREKLAQLHQQLFAEGTTDPLAPVRLEVIDRATDEALKRLKAAGLILPGTRAARSLDAGGDGSVVSLLSEAERQQVEALRQQASRKLKMAKLLKSGELLEESRQALLDTIGVWVKL